MTRRMSCSLTIDAVNERRGADDMSADPRQAVLEAAEAVVDGITPRFTLPGYTNRLQALIDAVHAMRRNDHIAYRKDQR